MSAISNFMQTIIDGINSVVGNYGWSIIIFTILFRLILTPLDYKSKKSNRKMAKANVRLQDVQKKYADNKEELNKRTMEIYKEEGVNPLGGCLPMLLSWPLMIALFAMLNSLASNQAMGMYEAMQSGSNNIIMEGWLWIKNVWQPDALNMPSLTTIPLLGGFFKGTVIPLAEQLTRHAALKPILDTYDVVMKPLIDQYAGMHNGFFVLPVIAAASSFFQTKIMNKMMGTSTTEGPAASQTKMMMYFTPILSLWICSTYSAAASLYWVTSNLCMIAQQVLLEKYMKYKEEKAAGLPEKASK